MTTSAQLTIAYDGVSLRCEGATDTNGTRAKIDGVFFTDLPAELRDWLDTRLTQLKDREAAALRQLRTENANYIANAHGTDLAQRACGELAFSAALQRFRLRDKEGLKAKSEANHTNIDRIEI